MLLTDIKKTVHKQIIQNVTVNQMRNNVRCGFKGMLKSYLTKLGAEIAVYFRIPFLKQISACSLVLNIN